MRPKIMQAIKTYGKTFLLAFIMAIALWYNATAKARVDVWVDVKVTYAGIPANLVVTHGLEDKISVLVRTTRGLASSLQGRDYYISINLSTLTPGMQEVPIYKDQLPFTGVYEVAEITPKLLQLTVDELTEKTMPLEAALEELPADVFLKSLKFEPSSVVLRGPRSLLAELNELRTPIKFSEHNVNIPIVSTRELAPPNGMRAVPSSVEVHFTLGLKSKNVRLTRELSLPVPANIKAEIFPKTINISVDLPESQVKNADTLSAVLPMVSLAEDKLKPGLWLAPVKLLLPRYAELVQLDPEQVLVLITAVETPGD